MIKKKKSFCFATFVFSAGLTAVAAVFPSPSGDLASASDWGGALPGNDERITLSNGTFTVSTDVEFGGIERVYNTRNAPNVMVIDQTEQKDVKVLFSGFRPLVNVLSPGHTNWFKGGWFDFKNGEIRFDKNYDDDWANANNQCLVLTDGAMVTNVSSMTLYGTASTGTKVFVDGSSLYVGRNTTLSGYGQASASEILVSGGGLFHLGGRLILTDGVASDSRKSTAYFTTNRLVVAGDGSRFIGLGSPTVSTGGNGDYILVTDGAYFSGKVYFGTGNRLSTNSLMRVTNRARADLTEVRLCTSEMDGLAGGRFEILDGAVVSNDNFFVGAYASGAMANGAAGCSLLVSNATFVTKYLSIGQGVCGSNNSVVISGSAAKFDHVPKQASQWTYFAGGKHCLFQVENGAVVEWRHQDGWSYSTPVSNCTVRITGGAVLKRNGGFHTGSDRIVNSGGNSIEILDGGKLDVSGKVQISGDGCSVVVSNGTLSAKELVIGAENPAGSITGNGLAVIAGTNPKISVTNGTFSVINSSTLRYDLSDGIYSASGHVPVEVKGAAIFEDGCSIVIENADAARAGASGPVTLLKADSISASAAMIEAAEAGAGGMCRVRIVESDGHSLLQLRFAKGLSFSIR
ncbi:MAG: hypothetical protein J6N18_02195 [Kiritimatiellae bacterium]|nr:hypothetical protein [Kiritimatiellia bacterium]